MKKLIISLCLPLISYSGFCQQVPNNVSLVIKYNGARFDESLPIEKIDQYKFIQSLIQKEMNYEGIFPLDRSGIDFTQTAIQYIQSSDSGMSFVTRISIKNLPDFLELVKRNYRSEMKTTKAQHFEYLKISNHKYLGWDGKNAILVYVSTNEKYGYDYYYPSQEVTDSVNNVVDSIVDARRKEINEMEDRAAVIEKSKKKKKKEIEEDIAPPVVSWYAEDEDLKYDLRDSINALLSDQWYKERDSVKAAQKRAAAIQTLTEAFEGKNTISLSELKGYGTVTDETAHANVWLNYGSLYNQLISQFWSGFYGYNPLSSMQHVLMSGAEESGYIMGMNLFFEKDQIKIKQLVHSQDGQLQQLSRQMYKSRQSRALAGYINPNHLGYLSVSFNSEAMIHYYYKSLKDYFGKSYFTSEYADLINLYVDLLEIAIDEKGLSELAPGNMIFVLHKMGLKEVTYKDYEYDDDFNQKEIMKTKTELSPDFTFSIATKRADFMQKLVAVPVKYAEKGNYKYAPTGNYFTLSLEDEKTPVNALYFGVKDDRVVITTSKETIENTFSGKGYKLNGQTKKNIFSNNYAGVINTKQVLQAIGPELSTETNRKIRKLLEENLGNITMESNFKNGLAQTTYALKIDGNHSNSFEFLFNITDAIRGIIEVEKEKEKTERETF